MDPKQEVRLIWQKAERFTGTVGGVPITLDGGSDQDLSPTQALAGGLAACMAIDVALILEKGRQPLEGLEVHMTGERSEKPPRRFVSFRCHFRVTGKVDPSKVERAIELSRETYCSVYHSLKDDLVFETSSEVVGP